MALPASDSFNRADGAIGANWTAATIAAISTGLAVSSNRSVSAVANYGMAFWNVDAFAVNQYSQATMISAVAYCGPGVRISAGGNGYIWLNTFGSDSRLIRLDGGSFNLIASGGTVPAAGSVIRVEGEGSVITAKDDGVFQMNATDATYTAGSAGLWHYDVGAPQDDWEGGNLGLNTGTGVDRVDYRQFPKFFMRRTR